MKKNPIEKKVKGPQFELAKEGSIIEGKYFFFDTSPDYAGDLAIVFGGFEKCSPKFEITRRTFPYYVIEVPLKGRCGLEIASHKHTLERGTIGGFSPDKSHHYKCDPDNPMEHIFIVFTGKMAGKILKASNIEDKGVIPQSDPGQCRYIAEAILKTGLEKGQYSQEICTSYLNILLLGQSASLLDQNEEESSALLTFRKCKSYIDENFAVIKSPSQAADECGINVRYMSRIFKKYGDTTPSEYIARLKMNYAGSLLLTTSMSVVKIAYLLGYEDPYHFSRNFKNYHGISPSNFRSKHMSE